MGAPAFGEFMNDHSDFNLDQQQLVEVEKAITRSFLPLIRLRASAIRLLHLGHEPEEVAAMLMVDVNTIWAWHRRYRAEGITGLKKYRIQPVTWSGLSNIERVTAILLGLSAPPLIIIVIAIVSIAHCLVLTAIPTFVLEYADDHGVPIGEIVAGLYDFGNDPIATIRDFIYPPEKTVLLYSGGNAGERDIYILWGDSGERTRITHHPADDTCPSGGAEGSMLFSSNRDGNYEIYEHDYSTGHERRLTQDSGSDLCPRLSNGRVVFFSNRDGNWEIYMMKSDGTDVQRLTNSSGSDLSPNWSPDGTRIVFESDRDGNSEIYTMAADGTDVRRLTNDLASDKEPSWLEGGERIAFASNRDGNWDIYIVDADGSHLDRLTADPASDRRPLSWDSGRIFFQSTRSGTNEFYTMKIDGSDVRPFVGRDESE